MRRVDHGDDGLGALVDHLAAWFVLCARLLDLLVLIGVLSGVVITSDLDRPSESVQLHVDSWARFRAVGIQLVKGQFVGFVSVHLLEGDMPSLLRRLLRLLAVHGAALALLDAFDLVRDLCLVFVDRLVVVSMDRR